MGKTSGGGRSETGVKGQRGGYFARRETGLAWGRRARVGARARPLTSDKRRRPHEQTRRRGADTLTGIYQLISAGSRSGVCVDSLAFRLHCGATAAALLATSAVLTSRHLFGNPIDCLHTRDIPENVLNTYCWIHSTLTVYRRDGDGRGREAYPGVSLLGDSDLGVRYAKYYQWVAFMLLLQESEVNLTIYKHQPDYSASFGRTHSVLNEGNLF